MYINTSKESTANRGQSNSKRYTQDQKIYRSNQTVERKLELNFLRPDTRQNFMALTDSYNRYCLVGKDCYC